MAKHRHETSRRARLLPVLGIIALVSVLLAVGKFAMANNETTATDDTKPPVSTPTAKDKTEDGPKAPKRDKPSNQPEKTEKPDKKPGKKPGKKLRDKVQMAADGLPAPDATFRIASFNVLGASHTGAGGNKRGYAGGSTRMGWATQLIRGNNVSIVGLQEYEKTQHGTFSNITGGGWGIYPGLQVGNKGVRNSIAWNNGVWELVEAHTIPIPYFHGNLVPMPYVLLKHKATGRLAWFINIHNPASTRGPAQHWRDVATAKEIALMNQLQAPQSTNQIGTPTFLMGDFNEKSEAFCRVVPGATAQAANGGAAPCSPPAGHGIDWIFGSTPGVSFSNYVRMDGGLVNRVSDHPMIYADVTLTGEAPFVE